MRNTFCLWALITALTMPGLALANSPRDYLPLDPGSVFVAFYYDHYYGNDYYHKGTKVSGNTNYYANVGVFRPVYYTSIGPFTVDPQLILPFGEADLIKSPSGGLGDATFAATICFINNKEYKFIFAYTPFLTAPTGRYDPNSPVNFGSNRWATKHEVCVAKGFGDSTWLEVAAHVQFYSDNNDARDAENRTVTSSKAASYGGETHLSYNFTKDFFGSFDYYYLHGGETTINDTWQKDWVDSHTLGLSFAYMLTPHTQLMINGKTDASVYNGIMTSSFGARLGFIF